MSNLQSASRLVAISGNYCLRGGEQLSLNEPIAFFRMGSQHHSFIVRVRETSMGSSKINLARIARDLKLPLDGSRVCVRLTIKDGEISGKHAELLRQRGLQLALVSPPGGGATAS